MMCYPDLHADDGISDVEDVDELYKLGFQLVTCHCFGKGALSGMFTYGMHVMKDRNTIFTENDKFLGTDPDLIKKYYSLSVNQDYRDVDAKLEKSYKEVQNFKMSTEKVR